MGAIKKVHLKRNKATIVKMLGQSFVLGVTLLEIQASRVLNANIRKIRNVKLLYNYIVRRNK